MHCAALHSGSRVGLEGRLRRNPSSRSLSAVSVAYRLTNARHWEKYGSLKWRRGVSDEESEGETREMMMDAEAFIEHQRAEFEVGSVVDVMDYLIPEVDERLKAIVLSAGDFGEGARVMDVGCGTGCLIPHLLDAGVKDYLGVDLSSSMLQRLNEKFPSPGIDGNAPGLRTWRGDFMDVPEYMGPVDAIYFNSVFGNLFDQHKALIHATRLLHDGGQLIVSHPMGKPWHEEFKRQRPDIVPNPLPSTEEWATLTQDLPFNLTSFTNDPELYLAVLQIPEGYVFEGAPIFIEGQVILGKGLGSTKMGIPTANLQPDSFQEQLSHQPRGVYYGWAQLEDNEDVHGAVINVGYCPTLKGDSDISLEAHVLHSFTDVFYGKSLKLALLGFLRPEMKFSGVDALLRQIKTDIGKAKNQLDKNERQEIRSHRFFTETDA